MSVICKLIYSWLLDCLSDKGNIIKIFVTLESVRHI